MKKLPILILLLLSTTAFAQKVAVSTNAADWLSLGTMNAEVSLSLAQHFSIYAGLKENPWEFHQQNPVMTVRNQMDAFYAGVRWWPWYVYSGWWLSMRGQYRKYSYCGVWRPALEEATSIGGGISAGYSLMMGKHLNLDFGMGVWGGVLKGYVLYCCPQCMDIRDSGERPFIRPDDIRVCISYVF